MSVPDPHAAEGRSAERNTAERNTAERNTAVTDRREQIAQEPRPAKQLPTPDVVETDDLWRVYHPEWMVVGVARDVPEADVTLDFMALAYEGRVKPDDIRRVVVGEPPFCQRQLQLRLPNLRGEFKTFGRAEAYAKAQGWTDATIAVRNSRQDYKVRGYGTRRLAK